MTLIDRRELLVGAGALAFASSFPAWAGQSAGDPAQALLAGIAEALLADYPENASALGLDNGARAALKSRLSDRSRAGQQALAERAAARLARLRAIDPAALAPAARIDLDVVRTAHETAVEGFAFPYGDMAVLNQNWSYRNAPYAVAQNTGAFVEIPDLLDSNHKVENAADAEAYLARLEAYAAALDGETGRLAHDAALGVVAPDFLLDKSLRQQRAVRAAPIPEWGLVTSLARRTAAMPGAFGRRAEALVAEKVAPALDRQIAELARHRLRATADAGVWKLPEGEAYYAWALKAGTTTTRTPDEVHEQGLEQLRALQAEMDVLLRAQGLTRGSVGARMAALGAEPRQLFPNDDEGRRQLLAFMNARIDDMRTRLPRAFATLVAGNLIVKRVPPEIEIGAPGAYAAAGSIDGSVPGNLYVNLHDLRTSPRFGLTTLAFHEGIPGHVWQGEYTYRLPLVRSLLAFNAYSEGWALYAEQLGAELGVYDEDPLGRLGYLQSIAFRACRLVVDTGLHARRWTRDHAIRWFATTNGSPLDDVRSEVDRYCAWPGQACGYKVGHSEINRLRDMARAALGPRFDFRLFNDALVTGGNVPLVVLGRIVEAHVAARRG
ncbi:MAG: hypothetical protein QOD42_1007 [Sphingomonadales bacterium]|jgi:uncharacterized protein (DUF885 family)|nr:hypothetical protein [Sphingomonadales bacterium]